MPAHPKTVHPGETKDAALPEKLRAAAELLEQVAHNRALLGGLTEDERTRLLKAAGHVSRPDAIRRRQFVKASQRQRKADKSQRAESVLAETGIRKLRRKPVFTTPNVHPPIGFEQMEVKDDPELVKTAPHSTRVSRLDEVGAARKPVLRWKKEIKLSEAAD